MTERSWAGMTLISILLIAAMVTAFTWACLSRSVAEDRRHHVEHLREIEVCRVAPNPADCFHRLLLP